jgi:RNA polymerase sigma factor (sigma-70 family)
MRAKIIQFPGPRRLGEDRIVKRNKLVEEYMYVVEPIARGIHARRPPSFSVGDLIQVGMLGLVTAAETYDSGLDVPFEAWAKLKVRSSILDATRRKPYRDSTHEEMEDWHTEMRDPRPNAEEQMIADERIATVQRVVQTLPTQMKVVIVGKYEQRRNLGDLGSKAGVSSTRGVTDLHRSALAEVKSGLRMKGYSEAMPNRPKTAAQIIQLVRAA